MEYFLSFLLIVMEQYALVLFFDAFFSRKVNKRKFSFFFLGWILAYYFVINIFLQGMILRLFITVLLCWQGMGYLYEGSPWAKLTLCTFWEALLWGQDLLSIIIIAQITTYSVESVLQNPLIAVIAGPISKITLVLCGVIIKRLHPATLQRGIRWIHLVLLCPFPLVSGYIMIVIAEISGSPNGKVITCSVLLLVANLALFIILDFLEKEASEHEEIVLLKQQIQLEMDNIKTLETTYATQKAITHDYNQHLNVLKDLLKTGNLSEGSEYLNRISKLSMACALKIHTGHSIIDALLNQKYTIAVKNQIEFEFSINNLSDVVLDCEYLVIMISNLLDNAIEACQKVPSSRQIQLVLLLENNELFLSIRNTALPVKITNGTITTTKKDRHNHGYGLKNVKRVLALYGVTPEMEYTNGWFQFTCGIPNKTISQQKNP